MVLHLHCEGTITEFLCYSLFNSDTVVHVYTLGHHVRDATIQELLCHVVEFYAMIYHLSQPGFHTGFHIGNPLEI